MAQRENINSGAPVVSAREQQEIANYAAALGLSSTFAKRCRSLPTAIIMTIDNEVRLHLVKSDDGWTAKTPDGAVIGSGGSPCDLIFLGITA